MNLDYSVGIPVRNEEKSIPYTLESILNQTITPKEILVCVNGSSDKTQKIVEEYSRQNNLIKLLNSNPGKPCAWNKITSQVLYNQVMFCDGDVIINKEAGEKLLENLEKNKEIILVGGSNKYSNTEENFFKRYFLENKNKIITPRGICGRLYMVKLREMQKEARELGIELIPERIINEDALLGTIAMSKKIIIKEAYATCHSIDSFSEWIKEYKRILAGNFQLKEILPEEFYKEYSNTKKSTKVYLERFNQIEGLGKKIGVTTLFGLRKILKNYYTFFGELDYKTTWEETISTKKDFKEEIKEIV
jgi:glycosyltransferase involved in cell wall biosynthesis